MSASKTMKSTKILVLESFRLYGSLCHNLYGFIDNIMSCSDGGD